MLVSCKTDDLPLAILASSDSGDHRNDRKVEMIDRACSPIRRNLKCKVVPTKRAKLQLKVGRRNGEGGTYSDETEEDQVWEPMSRAIQAKGED